MYDIDASAPVLVTGATGYVAGWVIERLLAKGCSVHAAVRDPSNKEKLKYLDDLAEKLPGTITYFETDLLKVGSYAEGMAGCELVFHTASPFTTAVKDPQKELVDPAKLGTRNVLEEASRCPTVKKVVLTSSCASIYGDSADSEDAPGGVLTEEVWNTTSTLEHSPYSFSKTEAEKEAWRIAEGQDRWKLVVINPSLVVGPGINPHATSESFNLVKQMGDGTLKSGAPRLGIGAVDVRDVADAHIEAGFRSEAEGRHIVSAENTDFYQLSQMLRAELGDTHPFPKRVAPKWLIWLVGPMVNPGLTRKFVSRNVDHPIKLDNAKSKTALGLEYRPVKTAMVEMFRQLVDSGQV